MTTPDSEVEKLAKELFKLGNPNMFYPDQRWNCASKSFTKPWFDIARHVLALQEAKRREVIKECVAEIEKQYPLRENGHILMDSIGTIKAHQAILAKLENPEQK